MLKVGTFCFLAVATLYAIKVEIKLNFALLVPC